MPSVPTQFRAYTFIRYTGGSPLGQITFAGFHVQGKGSPPNSMQPAPHFVLIYPVKGRARYSDTAGNKRLVTAGDLLLICPGAGYRYTPEPDEPWSEIWFTFRGPAFDLWRDQGLIKTKQPVQRLLPIEYWHSRLEMVLMTGQKHGGHNPLEQVCALQSVLAEALEPQAASEAPDPTQVWLAKASALLDVDNLAESLSLEQVADQMNVSYDQFRKRYAALSGISPYHYRMARIMDRACRLMQTRRLTNREIADRLGFSSEFHFSRRFKQHVGMSPKEFRQRVRMAADEESAGEPSGDQR